MGAKAVVTEFWLYLSQGLGCPDPAGTALLVGILQDAVLVSTRYSCDEAMHDRWSYLLL